MNVLHPNVPEPSLALMSAFSGEFDGDDSTQHRESLTRGQHYFARLFSAGPVPGGQTVVVTVGTRSFDIAAANDVEVHSKSDFRWFINSVEVRTRLKPGEQRKPMVNRQGTQAVRSATGPRPSPAGSRRCCPTQS